MERYYHLVIIRPRIAQRGYRTSLPKYLAIRPGRPSSKSKRRPYGLVTKYRPLNMEETGNARYKPTPRWVGKYRRQPYTELDKWDRASVAVDCVLFTVEEKALKVLAWLRANEPARGRWALPGAFVNYQEAVDVKDYGKCRFAITENVGLA